MLHRAIIIAEAILVATFSAFAIDHQDEVYGTWYNTDTHHIVDSCWVHQDSTLIIEEGCVVQFDGDYDITVNGVLTAGNSTGDQVIFTADIPQHEYSGFWGALIALGIQGNLATMTLKNCEIRYGGDPRAAFNVADGVIQGRNDCQVVVDSCYIHDNSGPGVTFRDYPDVKVRYNTISNCDHGIKIYYSDEDSEVKNNYVVDCSTGMYMHNPEIEIENNIFAKNKSHGIYCEGDIGVFINNVIDSTGDDCHGIYFLSGFGGSDLRNNIFTDCDSLCVRVLPPPFGNPIDLLYSCFYDTGVGICNNPGDYTGRVLSDPRFIESYGDDNYYHLKWNSPCLGSGDTVLSNSNPAVSRSDMGAYGGPYADLGMKDMQIPQSKP